MCLYKMNAYAYSVYAHTQFYTQFYAPGPDLILVLAILSVLVS